MRDALITGQVALRSRLSHPAQVVADDAPEAELPAYLESFLAHLRLLVGVPFQYLISDDRLLPNESIRFFYLDRSWTDRLVDGVFAVGKIGTREQAHHQAAHPAIRAGLDVTERMVRNLQRGRVRNFDEQRNSASGLSSYSGPAQVTTGFVLRSDAVVGWPHMDVRAFSEILTPDQLYANPNLANTSPARLPLLRLERLAPSILVALFDGIPQLVWLEEPHHGVQFGVHRGRDGNASIFRRGATGIPEEVSPTRPEVHVPMRKANNRVVAVAELRKRLYDIQMKGDQTMTPQTGSAALAIEVLQPPWRQRFEGTVDGAKDTGSGSGTVSKGGFVPSVLIAGQVTRLSVGTVPGLNLEVRR